MLRYNRRWVRRAGRALAAALLGAAVGCSFGSDESTTESGGDGGESTSADGETGSVTSTSGVLPTGTGGGDASSGDLPVDDGTDTSTSDDPMSTSDEGDSTTSDAESSSDDGPMEVEVCDGKDNDGDGGIDEGSPRNPTCNNCDFVLSTDGQSYFALCTNEENWDDARTACEVFGPTADLATIDNQDDNELLIGLTAEDYFIGLDDLAEEGEWLWIDGTVSITGGVKQDYNGWSNTQPSGGFTQNCGELDPGQNGWADAGCESLQRYICEHPI